MPPIHSIDGHALLTGPAADWDGVTVLPAHVLVAERVLNITADFTGTDDEDSIKSALALQVSYQGELEADGLWYLSRSSRGSRTTEGRSNAQGQVPPIHPLAQKILDDVSSSDAGRVSGSWNVFKSLRG